MNPDIAVILNIDEDHLDFFKNLDNIKSLFANLPKKLLKLLYITAMTKTRLIR